MSNELATTNDRLSAVIRSEDIMQNVIAGLPEWLNPDQFIASAMAAFSDPELASVPVRSKVLALMDCVQMGLAPGASGHVYLIKRGGKLCADPSARGLRFLAERQPGIERVEARLVRAGDTFKAEPSAANPGEWIVVTHVDGNGFFGTREIVYDESPIKSGCLGGYVEVTFTDGSKRWHNVPWSAIWKASKSAQSSKFWKDHTVHMATKTLLRDAHARGALRGSAEVEARLGRAMLAIQDSDSAVADKPVSIADAIAAGVKVMPIAPQSVLLDDVEQEANETHDDGIVDCDPTDAPAIDTSLPLMELLGVVANRLDAMPDVLMQEVCMELDIKTTTIKRMSTEEQDSVRQWLIGAIGSV